MKQLHRQDLRGWSSFDESRDIDFNGVLWLRPGGNVLIDPMPMCEHDLAQLQQLGGAATIVVTNSDHVRDTVALAERFSAEVVGPAGEADNFPIACGRTVGDGETIVEGLRALAMEGSKTPGELALLLQDSTLITGDLVRGQRGGELNMLPDAKLADRSAAVASVRRLQAWPGIEAVLVGDGWPIFHDGSAALRRLVASLD